MSEKPSEYLKRTCLICGCHTNQTINIYEPRSGPNIVQLIQAKFKFQPLNEDKYLCFSCNNWLINWHSLQALNSNDAESPSGTFRSHISGSMVEERDAVADALRPVAAVRPWQLTQEPTPTERNAAAAAAQPHPPLPRKCRRRAPGGFNKKQRRFRLSRRWRRRTARPRCHVTIASKRTAKQSAAVAVPVPAEPPAAPPQSLVNSQAFAELSQSKAALPAPRVDGKVVAMLRRLGTTLSREQRPHDDASAGRRLPPIMSPTKPKPRWTRPLEDDEILLDFDTAISEALPTAARRRLTYHMSLAAADSGDDTDTDADSDADSSSSSAAEVLRMIPAGLSVSLV